MLFRHSSNRFSFSKASIAIAYPQPTQWNKKIISCCCTKKIFSINQTYLKKTFYNKWCSITILFLPKFTLLYQTGLSKFVSSIVIRLANNLNSRLSLSLVLKIKKYIQCKLSLIASRNLLYNIEVESFWNLMMTVLFYYPYVYRHNNNNDSTNMHKKLLNHCSLTICIAPPYTYTSLHEIICMHLKSPKRHYHYSVLQNENKTWKLQALKKTNPYNDNAGS